MKRYLLAATLLIGATMAATAGANAAPAGASQAQGSIAQQSGIDGFTLVDRRGHRHNCNVHGWCGFGGSGGLYLGDGFSIYLGGPSVGSSCRNVRRYCRNEWGTGSRYRRCVRRQDCRP